MHVFVVTIYGLGLVEQFTLRSVSRNLAERDACRMFHVITNGVSPEHITTF